MSHNSFGFLPNEDYKPERPPGIVQSAVSGESSFTVPPVPATRRYGSGSDSSSPTAAAEAMVTARRGIFRGVRRCTIPNPRVAIAAGPLSMELDQPGSLFSARLG